MPKSRSFTASPSLRLLEENVVRLDVAMDESRRRGPRRAPRTPDRDRHRPTSGRAPLAGLGGSERPSRSSITRYGMPSAEIPESKTWMAFGWFTRQALIPSRWKRSSAIAESFPAAGPEIFTATAARARAAPRGRPPRSPPSRSSLRCGTCRRGPPGEDVGERREPIAVGATREGRVLRSARVLPVELLDRAASRVWPRAPWSARRPAPRALARAASGSPRARTPDATTARAGRVAEQRPPGSQGAGSDRNGTTQGPRYVPA